MTLAPAWSTLPGFPGADPAVGLAGGALIGLAAALVLIGLGRIAGVSGLAARAFGLADDGPPRGMAVLFILGLPLGAGLVYALTGLGRGAVADWPYLLVAGVLVGLGTRLGSGCTSGHGVCGIGRLSARSIVATIVFICAGMVTVAVVNMLKVAG